MADSGAALKVLLIEDSPSDAALVKRELGGLGRPVESTWVRSQRELAEALSAGSWDLVLSDFSIPQFDVLSACELVRATCDDIPFLVVSGTIGEERAVELMHGGIADVVLKDRLSRLNGSIERALREVEERRALAATQQLLVAAGEEWRRTFSTISDGVILTNPDGIVHSLNPAALRQLAVEHDAAVGAGVIDLLVAATGDAQREPLEQSHLDKSTRFELGPSKQDSLWFAVKIDPILGPDDAVEGWILALSDITELKRSQDRLTEAVTQLERTISGAVSIAVHMVEKRDPYTAGHQENVAKVAVAIGERMGLASGTVELIRVASLLHDIGKIAVPAEILVKPGKLDQYEWMIMQRHPQVSAEILEDVELGGPIAEIIRQHHERIDGSGYPAGLSGDEICLEARVIAVADVTEAMRAHRPYRPALTADETRAELVRGRATLYDPAVVDACLASPALTD